MKTLNKKCNSSLIRALKNCFPKDDIRWYNNFFVKPLNVDALNHQPHSWYLSLKVLLRVEWAPQPIIPDLTIINWIDLAIVFEVSCLRGLNIEMNHIELLRNWFYVTFQSWFHTQFLTLCESWYNDTFSWFTRSSRLCLFPYLKNSLCWRIFT